jgi:hypothetical protein
MRQSNRVLCLIGVTAFLAAAQTDPPGRVGRISYVTGAVSVHPGDVEDWLPAEFNRPLTSGDHVWVDDNARAEVNVGAAALRLNSRTAFQFLNLDDSNIQIRLAEGSLNIRLRNLGDRESFEVDTPNLSFSLLRPGEYRIDVNPDSLVTAITARAGEGEVTALNQVFPVHMGEQATLTGSDSPNSQTLGAPARDAWDDWCSNRDRRDDQSRSARYVSREMVGYQDFDNYGDWRTVPDYGPVWVPNGMAAGWAPYHNGHWAWVDPWGWTWVDDAPWGFAPFHYGRWVYVGYWAWVPGPVAVRPVYAPALVAWVGGPSFGVSIGIGGGGAAVGWFPLGPREPYIPAYRASTTYINQVNVTNTTIVNNVNVTNINTTNIRYVNREAPGGVTAVPQASFASSRPVQAAAVPVQAQAIRSAQVVTTAAVAPTRQSVVGSAAPSVKVAQPPAAIQSRAVVAKATPPPPPVPFAQKQQALAANPGRPLDTGALLQLRSSQPAPPKPLVRQAPTGAPGAARPTIVPTAPPPAGNQPQPQRPVTPVRPAAPQSPTPPQQPRAVPPAQPPQREAQPSNPQPAPRVVPPAQPPQREAQPSNPQPAPRAVPPAQPPQRDAQPANPQPAPRVAPPAQPPQREAQPDKQQPAPRVVPPAQPQQREAQPARPQQPPPAAKANPDVRKDTKKDNKSTKDEKDRKE